MTGNVLEQICTNKDFVLFKIKKALKNLSETDPINSETISDLKIAIEMDSNEAIYLMADLILQLRINLEFIEKIRYLELAASLNHVEAVYSCGGIYGCLLAESTPNNLVNPSKAIFYLMKAVDLHHPQAVDTLLRAIFDKEPPNIIISPQRFTTICEDLIAKGEMKAALYYGMVLAGYHPEDFHMRDGIGVNYELAIENVLLAYKSGNQEIKQQAYEVLKKGHLDKIWPASYNTQLQNIVDPKESHDGKNIISVIRNVLNRF